MPETILPMVGMCVGVYVTLIGFRWVSPSRPTADPARLEEWYRQYGWLMRLLGPAVFLVSLSRLLRVYEVF